MKYIISKKQYRLLESPIDDGGMKSNENFKYHTSEDGEFKDIFLDNTISDEYKNKIRDIFKEIKVLTDSSDGENRFENIIHIVRLFDKLKRIKKFLNHNIYLNEYKDKYGNVYLQGRTSIKDETGKTKWINAYVGNINDYPDGVNSIEGLIKGKNLIRKKLEPYFNI